ncbi:MAG: hemerythrin domain-containing protein, partial [Gammaproteobacteria bacterium]|nr:hemerythrin domain-containing protein [Gammaproteobacteria bacterium]
MRLPASTPDFDDPLEMLAACHTRIESQCMTLLRLPAYLSEHGNDAAVREAASKVIRYFETAGRHHHQDEEQDLFPILIARADAAQRALIGNLAAQHQDLEVAWRALKPLLAMLAEGGAVSE